MKDNLKEKLKFLTFMQGTVPGTVYMGKVYTQLVLIEFDNGQKTYVFDGPTEGHMHCTPDMIGKTKEVVLVMLVLSLEQIQTHEKRVDSSLTRGGDFSGPNLEIKGYIEEIIFPDNPKNAERRYDAVVDFGVGKILIEIKRKYFHLNLKEGDYVHVYGRVDLWDIQ